MKLNLSRGLAAAGILTASLTVVGSALAAAPSGGAYLAQSQALQAPSCRPTDLYVVKGRLEGAAGNRYLTVKITNVGDAPCTTGVVTRAAFRDWSGVLGSKGALSSGGAAISLDQGRTVRTTIHWTDPGPVPAAACDKATATLVTLRLPSLAHTWRLPLRAQVCTTPDYAPDSKPLH
ncbi:DUF4232 domain-containing protein [Nocardioides agariphilus]|jgi:hypothetical protein|uniref:DUF4232 domain-containing protein n=1 Tax=Nocardioides agariphilus TaxID=433664 RepID=A0A930YMU3_9ACTN|nr:DUF4232 domain-containing protein [Nocardioides agariphilus]MBF4768494.1 DUF4232 domain-containing protein [Nocardioides agariphilus]